MKGFAQATIFVAVVFVVGSACASGGGAHGSKCEATPADTIYRPFGMVYRPCAVDREARLTSSPRPTFLPAANGSISCYSADFEFVVDAAGKPVVQTLHTLHANDRSFEASVSEVIPGLLYEPAMKEGHPVNQITKWGTRLSVVKVIAPAGAPIRPPQQRAPAC